MARFATLCGIASLVAVGIAPVAANAQSGPCTDDIGKLSRQLGTTVGLGAPVSQPETGQSKGPSEASTKQADANATGSVANPVGTPETDRAQKGGASRESGGSAGTVGGVAGPTGPTGQADAVATGRVATSPEDVRRQSENRPTAAASAATGGDAKGSGDAGQEDRTSRAKMALQRAVDLNAKGDGGCRDALKEAQELAPRQGG